MPKAKSKGAIISLQFADFLRHHQDKKLYVLKRELKEIRAKLAANKFERLILRQNERNYEKLLYYIDNKISFKVVQLDFNYIQKDNKKPIPK